MTTAAHYQTENRNAFGSMRIAVVGPGAIGSTIAAWLHRAGHELLLCGRAYREQLEVHPDDGDPIVVPGPVHVDTEAINAPVGLVIFAVKATQLDDASHWLTVLCDDKTVVCALQNGVEQVELVQPHCPSSRVVPAIAWFSAELGSDGATRLRNKPDVTLPHSAGIAADVLQAAGCAVNMTADFTTAAWRKLLFNAAGALMALTGRRSGMFRRDDIAALARDYLTECLAVARAEGAQLEDEVTAWTVDLYREIPPDITSSMRTDRMADRPLEWDILNGAVLRKAHKHGLPAPISEVVVPLLAAASDGPG